MSVYADRESTRPAQIPWRQAIARYQSADTRHSLWQLANTLIPYVILWYLMWRSLSISYWLTLALAVPAAGFLMRIFIFFHDAGHGSFFGSQKANDIVGIITGILTFTPYHHWRYTHAVHHATVGDLDRRGTGDVWTMTVAEYQAAPRLRRLIYRAFRFPPFTFLIGPLFMFLLAHRLPLAVDKTKVRERRSVHWTNLALLGIVLAMGLTIGLKAYLLIQLPMIMIAGPVAVWMFYVQHQFEGVYWERHERWDFVAASLEGSSFYRVPALLAWFSGDIGYHHIHHLGPRVPNYKLRRCYNENPIFQVSPLTVRASLKSLKLHLWDEERRALVEFSAARQRVGADAQIEGINRAQ